MKELDRSYTFDIVGQVARSPLTAQLVGLLYGFGGALLLSWPYYLIWHESLVPAETTLEKRLVNAGLAILLMVLGICVHEWIHAVTWMLAGKLPRAKIRFGIQKSTYMPYCHCFVPMQRNAYQLGVLMPFAILGVIPMAVAVFTGSVWVFMFACFFTVAAGADLLLLRLLIGVPKHYWLLDHPMDLGCQLLLRKEISS